MPSDAEQLRTIKSQVLAVMAEVTAAPKPSYNVDGQRMSWNDYLLKLRGIVTWCDERLAALEPYEVRTEAGG
jgi:hypothetical protein